MTLNELESSKDWISSSYEEGTEEQVDFFLNINQHNIGDIAYVYTAVDDELNKLKILDLCDRSTNQNKYDCLSDVILDEKAEELNADISAEFITDDNCYLVWFKTVYDFE